MAVVPYPLRNNCLKVVLMGVLVSEAPHDIIEDQEELGPHEKESGHGRPGARG